MAMGSPRRMLLLALILILTAGPVLATDYLRVRFPGIRKVSRVIKKYKNKPVQILGYMVPVTHSDQAKYFLLVPDALACIHKPAPPINQIVYVEMEKDVQVVPGVPVYVTGMFRVSPKMHPVFGKTLYRMTGHKVKRAY